MMSDVRVKMPPGSKGIRHGGSLVHDIRLVLQYVHLSGASPRTHAGRENEKGGVSVLVGFTVQTRRQKIKQIKQQNMRRV